MRHPERHTDSRCRSFAAIKEAGEIVGLTGLVEHFGQVKNPYDTRLVTCSLWLGQSNRSSGR